MAKVPPYYTGAETEYYVDRLSYRKRPTRNHLGFLTSTEWL
jgi:hypothetical protein